MKKRDQETGSTFRGKHKVLVLRWRSNKSCQKKEKRTDDTDAHRIQWIPVLHSYMHIRSAVDKVKYDTVLIKILLGIEGKSTSLGRAATATMI